MFLDTKHFSIVKRQAHVFSSWDKATRKYWPGGSSYILNFPALRTEKILILITYYPVLGQLQKINSLYHML